MLASNAVRMLSLQVDTFQETKVEQAMLLTDVSFSDLDGEEILVRKGTEVVVDEIKGIACTAEGVQFEIFPYEYHLLSLN